MFETLNQGAHRGDEYNEPVTQIADKPIKVKHTPARLAHDILEHNKHTRYSQVGVVGVPGSGKTTMVNCIVHHIHKKDESYQVHHYKKEQILKLDEILEELPKRQNCILVFDDVSYLFEKLSGEKIAEILHSLTIIREKLDPQYKETKCIVFLLFHYSFALVKGLRTTNFRIICSVSDEEVENYKKTLGYHNAKRIYDYVKKYMSMMRYGKFRIRSNTEEPFVYYTDQPFRIALVSNIGELHYTLYYKAGCAKCLPRSAGVKYDKPDLAFWNQLIDKYGESLVENVLSKYIFVQTRKPTVNVKFRAIWNHIQGQERLSRIDMLTLAKVFKEAKKIKNDDQQEQALRRHEHIQMKLKDMYDKAVTDESKAIQDGLENIKAESLDGDEDSIDVEFEDDMTDEGDDDLEGDMDNDERALKGGA